MKASSVLKIVGWVVFGIAVAVALGLLLGLAVKALWNWLMPVIFGLGTITYWQAVGMFVLCHLLFKSHHEGRRHGDGETKHFGPGSRFAEKVRGMIKGDREEARRDRASGDLDGAVRTDDAQDVSQS